MIDQRQDVRVTIEPERRLTQAEWVAAFERWREKQEAYAFERELRRDPDSVDG